jgi:hypothetical protein
MSTGVYNKTVGDLVRDSLRAASISGIEISVEASDFAQGFSAYNDLLAAWQAKQIHIWSETEAVMPLNAGQSKYVFGTDHAFTDYQYTTSESAILGATTLDVGSTTDAIAGDFIGIELSTGVRQWTTVDTVTDADTFELADALEAAVTEGASVYVYRTKCDIPVRFLGIRYSDNYTADEIPTWQISRQEYYDQTSKTAQGAINQWYYSRQLTSPYLNVWPTANSCANLVRFTFIKPQYVSEDQAENVQVPPEWYNAIKWQLAADLGAVYNIDANKQMLLEQKAQIYLNDAIGSDTDFSNIQFVCR